MGPQVYEGQCSKSKANEMGTIYIDAVTSVFNDSSTAVLEQRDKRRLDDFEPLEFRPLVTIDSSAFSESLIRCFDIVGSVVLLLLTAPLMLFTAVLVKCSSAGPVLYNQPRVGRNGKIFTLYKFRTMVDGAENDTGPVWAAKDDRRVTTIGKILRCTRLDELPQLFNVLQGDMSLVGPRPERPYFVKQHRVLQGVRLAVKPGITGLAQIRAVYDLKPEHKLKYDFLYIQKRSFLLNVYILLMTIPVVLLRKGW
jgi:lipopolysaccharide/colanic/teichoic acid biosynthesis glycosyltransferase